MLVKNLLRNYSVSKRRNRETCARLSQPADANQRVPRKNAVSGKLPLPDTTNMVVVALIVVAHIPIVEKHTPRVIRII